MSKGMMGLSITLCASGNETHVKWIDKKQDVPEFVSTVRGRMKGGAGNGAAAPATSEPDAADQIRSLAQLRDDGLLSEEEFQAEKAQLLGL
jgi:urease alpha subunit